MHNPLEIIWTEHAVARATERIGDCLDVKFPDGLIQWVGENREPGTAFRVAQGPMVYCCHRHKTQHKIIIKTVYENPQFHGNSGPDQGMGHRSNRAAGRRGLGRRAERSRASVKRELSDYIAQVGDCD